MSEGHWQESVPESISANNGLWLLPRDPRRTHEIDFVRRGTRLDPGSTYCRGSLKYETAKALLWNHRQEAGIEDVKNSQMLAFRK